MGARDVARSDRGSAIVLATGAVVFAALLAVSTAHLGVAMLHRERAQLAADAAALAGVDGGRVAATRLAQLNGAQLVSFRREGWMVTVIVRLGDAVARAGASNGP